MSFTKKLFPPRMFYCRPECISMPECPWPEDFFEMSELEDYETGIGNT